MFLCEIQIKANVMSTMPTRTLGCNEPQVSAIGFGAMGGSAYYGAVVADEERLFKVLDRVIELCITYIDSSDICRDSEEFLGKYFKNNPQHRSKVILTSKFGLATGTKSSRRVRGDGEFIREPCEKSRERLLSKRL